MNRSGSRYRWLKDRGNNFEEVRVAVVMCEQVFWRRRIIRVNRLLETACKDLVKLCEIGSESPITTRGFQEI